MGHNWSSYKPNIRPKPETEGEVVTTTTEPSAWFVAVFAILVGMALGALIYPSYESIIGRRVAEARAAAKLESAEIATHRTIDSELGVACYTSYSSEGALAIACVSLVDSCYWYNPKGGYISDKRSISEPIIANFGP